MRHTVHPHYQNPHTFSKVVSSCNTFMTCFSTAWSWAHDICHPLKKEKIEGGVDNQKCRNDKRNSIELSAIKLERIRILCLLQVKLSWKDNGFTRHLMDCVLSQVLQLKTESEKSSMQSQQSSLIAMKILYLTAKFDHVSTKKLSLI